MYYILPQGTIKSKDLELDSNGEKMKSRVAGFFYRRKAFYIPLSFSHKAKDEGKILDHKEVKQMRVGRVFKEVERLPKEARTEFSKWGCSGGGI